MDIYGDNINSAWPQVNARPRVFQTTSVYALPGTHEYLTLRINDSTPRSQYDFFLLNTCRARADVILLTGAIVRAEPRLTGGIMTPYQHTLARWRRTALHTAAPTADVVIITRGHVGIDWRHNIFDTHNARIFIYTTHNALHTLSPAIKTTATQLDRTHKLHTLSLDAIRRGYASSDDENSARLIHFVTCDVPSLFDCIEFFKRRSSSLSIECGSHATAPLYANFNNPSHRLVDDIFMSVYRGRLSLPLHEACVDASHMFALNDDFLERNYEKMSTAQHEDWQFSWFRLAPPNGDNGRER